MPDATPTIPLPETRATLRFLKYTTRFRFEKPFSIMFPGPLPNNAPKTNQEWETREVAIYDARDLKSEFTVEKNGFTWIDAPSKAVNTADLDPETFMELYIDETIKLLENIFHPDRIVCYDYRLRENVTMNYESLASTSRKDPAPPVYTVHIDHSNDGGLDRARRHLTEEECSEYIDSGLYRCRCINLWRPLIAQVEDSPLALCDPRTVNLADLVATDRWSPEYVGEVWDCCFRATQKWYWLSKQHRDELLMFSTFDSLSRTTKQVLAVPHSAFVNPDSSPTALPRRSVETRSMIFHRIAK